MIDDDVCYLSDTVRYIGYEYLKECSERYKLEHNDLEDEDVWENSQNVASLKAQSWSVNALSRGSALAKPIGCKCFYSECNNGTSGWNSSYQKWIR